MAHRTSVPPARINITSCVMASREPGAGQLYDRDHDIADGGDFLDNQKGDTYQFRLIVAPEDAARMASLKPFIRDLMIDMEEDLRTKLDWVAADHYNTGHPHTHIIIAGHDDCGEDLVMARHYISHGIRTRARDLVTLELGPELDFERVIKLANEMKSERFTSLDYGILKDAQENVLVISAMVDGTRGRQALRVGRLRHLQQMGLAEEKKSGVWIIDPQLDSKLRSIGARGDIIATMNTVMRKHGLDRAAGDFAIFNGAGKSAPVIGKVLEVEIADEMTDRKYIVVDGIDGRIHYAETSRLTDDNMPLPGMIVAMTGAGGKGKQRNAQIEIVSTWSVEKLRSVEAPTWLDQSIVAEKRLTVHAKGFGADVSKALVAREAWLIANGLAKSGSPGTITPNPDMLQDLHQRTVTRIAAKIATEYQLPHIPLIEGQRITGQHIRTIDMPLQRLAVIKKPHRVHARPLASRVGQTAGPRHRVQHPEPADHHDPGARPQPGSRIVAIAKREPSCRGRAHASAVGDEFDRGQTLRAGLQFLIRGLRQPRACC